MRKLHVKRETLPVKNEKRSQSVLLTKTYKFLVCSSDKFNHVFASMHRISYLFPSSTTQRLHRILRFWKWPSQPLPICSDEHSYFFLCVFVRIGAFNF